MKKTVLAFLFCLTAANVFAQKETFDVITYAPPAGWTKDAAVNVVSYTATNKNNNRWCRIGIIKSTAGKGGLEADFRSEWQELVVKNYAPPGAPQLTESQESNGWKIQAGIAKFIFNNADAIVLLTTMSGYGRSASIVATTNSEDYLKDIRALLSSVDLKRPEAAAPSPAAGTAGDGGFILATWSATASDQSTFRVNNGVMNYITRQYTFNADGSYAFFSKAFDPLMDKILLGRESGTYRISGDNLALTPARSVLEAWSKKDGADKWGRLLSSQNRPLESAVYRFARQYFSGLREWSLILRADRQTQRDGPFNGNGDFKNAWIYGPPCRDCLIKLPD
jgi:hypothetical protein